MSANNAKRDPYIITVEDFTDLLHFKHAPSKGTIAYEKPWVGSQKTYTFPTPTSNPDYSIDSLVFCGGDYWAHFINLGGKAGYVNCFEIAFDEREYAAPDKQTPNSQIGSNTNVIFNMWYFPVIGYIGVKYAIPLYYQYYYAIGSSKPINSLKCTLLSSISGYYLYGGKYDDPDTYLNDMTKKYWSDDEKNGGITSWIANMSRTATKDSILKKAKSNLDSHKPFLVGAQNEDKVNHLVLVTGYKNSGANRSDYIVLDSSQEKFSDLGSFFESFPNYPGWNIGGTGYVYGEY